MTIHSLIVFLIPWAVAGGVLGATFLIYKKRYLLALLLAMGVGLGVWMRYVEPYMITIEYATIDLGLGEDVALIADMHLGVYKDEAYLKRVVDQINTLDVDSVMVAGDFLNYPTKSQSFETLFTPLGDLQVPWYTVMGNHDVLSPYPDWEADLAQVLTDLGGQVIDNRIVPQQGWILIGLGSHMAGDDDLTLLEDDIGGPVVVLAHNPDSITDFPADRVDLTLVGHTHCGQVRIPGLYEVYHRYIIPTHGDFDCHWTQESTTQLYITPGLGEVILPIRLMNPVTISVLSL